MSLETKLQRLHESKSNNHIDWEKRKTEWQSEILKIFDETKSWLKSYIESGLIHVEESEILIREEFLGAYKVKQLEFEFGDFQLVFEPVGRNTYGAKGRIDLYLRGSKSDKYVLVLLDSDESKLKWYIYPFKDSSKRSEFNKTTMELLLETWIDHYTN